MSFPQYGLKRLMRYLVCLAALAAFTQLAFGQFSSTVEGTVTDASQASVPGALVILTNDLTQVTQQATTSETGFFRISQLPPGFLYTIEPFEIA